MSDRAFLTDQATGSKEQRGSRVTRDARAELIVHRKIRPLPAIPTAISAAENTVRETRRECRNKRYHVYIYVYIDRRYFRLSPRGRHEARRRQAYPVTFTFYDPSSPRATNIAAVRASVREEKGKSVLLLPRARARAVAGVFLKTRGIIVRGSL